MSLHAHVDKGKLNRPNLLTTCSNQLKLCTQEVHAWPCVTQNDRKINFRCHNVGPTLFLRNPSITNIYSSEYNLGTRHYFSTGVSILGKQAHVFQLFKLYSQFFIRKTTFFLKFFADTCSVQILFFSRIQ